MAKKQQKNSTPKNTDAGANVPLAGAIKASATQIWLAGLGAFVKAQEEGGKVFDTLVQEGLSIQRKTQTAAEDRLHEATSRMTDIAQGLTAKAAGQWDKLENIFEDRVARALGKLGVPSAKDLDALNDRIDALNHQLQQLSAPTRAAKAPARKVSATAKATRQPAAKARPQSTARVQPTPPAPSKRARPAARSTPTTT